MSLELLTLNVGRPPRDRAEALLAYLWTRPEKVLVLTEVGTGGGPAVVKASGYAVAGLGGRAPGGDGAPGGVSVTDRAAVPVAAPRMPRSGTVAP